MNIRWRLLTSAMLCILATSGFADLATIQRPRVWTSASGAEIMALFVELSGDQVILKNRQGDSIQIPRAKLSAADQALLDNAFGPAAFPASVPPPPNEEFPSLPTAVSVPPGAPPAAAQGAIVVAGVEIPLDKKTTFRVPLSPETIQLLKKEKNPATESDVGLWLPPDFDPKKPWSILLVSATANASSIGHMDRYLTPARTVGGWIVVAADGPNAPPAGDTTQWRWQMAQAGLLALDAAWPGARKWPVATGGFSGGAKRSGLLGAILCKEEWNVIGMYMGGCNEDMATAGLKEYRPKALAFRKVPVFLSNGKQDAVSTVQSANKVRLSLGSSGFRDVRLEIYDGAHVNNADHITESLAWFKELAAKRSP